VATGAADDEIRTAFKQLAKQQHPDKGGSLEAMQQLNLAYATLKNVATRRAYDRMHSFQTGTSELHYRSQLDDFDVGMDDDEIDNFIDDIFAEYAAKAPEPKKSVRSQATNWFNKRKG
jgi:DnaJ-class molecular chaperone